MDERNKASIFSLILHGIHVTITQTMQFASPYDPFEHGLLVGLYIVAKALRCSPIQQASLYKIDM